VTVLGLSRDILGFLPFSLKALTVAISRSACVQANLERFDFLDGQRNRFGWCACLAHASDQRRKAHGLRQSNGNGIWNEGMGGRTPLM
jgi:hypothetical protein